MKFIRTGDYEYRTEKVTEKELEEARKKANPKNFVAIGRSCWECNSAHVHHLDDGGEYNCFACGRVYMDNIDITDYTGSKFEEDAKNNLKKQKDEKQNKENNKEESIFSK